MRSKKLIYIVVILGLLVLLNKFYFSKKSESTFNDEFLKIDTSQVTQIIIRPKVENGKELTLTKETTGWSLQKDKVKVIADTAAIRNFLGNFAEIKSTSLASSDKSGWKDLQVDDSSGSKVKIMLSDNKNYEIVVGKFGYNQQTQGGITYIRHADEESVYAINGFLSFMVNQPMAAWRNKTFIHGNKEHWNTLTFTYPGDSSFVLARSTTGWTVNGQQADSTKTIQYLTALETMQNSSFVDSYTPSSTPIFTLTIQGNNQPAPITVLAYPADSTQRFILNSSLNKDAYFSDQSKMSERIFVGQHNFR